MSYTPTTWATGDSVTATKLNKLEQGVANAGGIRPIVCAIWFPDSSLGFQVYGDFSSALSLVQQGIPVACVYYPNFTSASYGFDSLYVMHLGSAYNSSTPNRIDFYITGGVGFHWTASGVEYFD